jgi:hypothetical protein
MIRAGVAQRRRSGAPVTYAGLPRASMGARILALLLTFGLVVVTLGVGWLVWSILEWHDGRTASFRLVGLRVVRSSDGRPIGLGRSILRNALLCTLLLVPVILICIVVAISFVMGASPPNDLFSKARHAPWDRLTGTTVVQERRRRFSRGKYAHLSDWPAANEPVSMN